jgi:hypothetical protein
MTATNKSLENYLKHFVLFSRLRVQVTNSNITLLAI